MEEQLSERGIARFVVVAVALGAVLRGALLIWGGGTMIDDAYITARFAQNLVQHGQLVYNTGEYVLGVSGPLYSLWVALHLLVLPAKQIGYALGATNILLYAATALAIFSLVKEVGARTAALAVLLFAGHLRFVDNSIVGMETPLFLLGIVLSLLLLRRGRLAWLSFVAALLMLIRPEGALWALSVLTVLAVQRRRLHPADVVPGVVVVVAWILSSVAYYGSPIPQSVLAKSGWLVPDAPTGFAQRAAAVFVSLSLLETPAVLGAAWYARVAAGVALVVSLVLFTVGAVDLIRRKSPLLALPVLFVLYCAFYILARGRVDFSWYGIPSGLAYVITAVAGLTWVTRGVVSLRWRRRVFALGAPVLLGALLVVALLVWSGSRLPYLRSIRSDYEATGEFIDRECAPDAEVLVTETGMIGWRARRVVHETAGIVSPEILAYARDRQGGVPFHEILDRFGTDVVVVDPLLVRAVEREGELEWMEQNYAVLAEFPGHTVLKRTDGPTSSESHTPHETRPPGE
ncbi:MAG: hypothetical protein JXB46_03520 [Candidatus Eisenbacteria bacterium]|nr:hypothetical protein [Candidatus Eisenbacteria bacterium]